MGRSKRYRKAKMAARRYKRFRKAMADFKRASLAWQRAEAMRFFEREARGFAELHGLQQTVGLAWWALATAPDEQKHMLYEDKNT